MKLTCPNCGTPQSSNLATHCDRCTVDGRPVELTNSKSAPKPVLIVAAGNPAEIELARRAFVAASKDNFEDFKDARKALDALPNIPKI